ncbi:hypothetical protein D3C80_881370 [compost metagenome]
MLSTQDPDKGVSQNLRHQIRRRDTVGRNLNPGTEHDPVVIALRPVHDIDRAFAVADFGFEETEVQIDPEIPCGLILGFQFQPHGRRIEILVERDPIHNLRYLVITIIVIECRSIQTYLSVIERIF